MFKIYGFQFNCNTSTQLYSDTNESVYKFYRIYSVAIFKAMCMFGECKCMIGHSQLIVRMDFHLDFLQ